jgi:hypothetical protein
MFWGRLGRKFAWRLTRAEAARVAKTTPRNFMVNCVIGFGTIGMRLQRVGLIGMMRGGRLDTEEMVSRPWPL